MVILPGKGLSVTPVFYGSNPAKVPQSHRHAGFRLLGDEEDAAFGLIRSLEGKTREAAIIGDRSLGNIVSGPGREAILQDYEGVPLSELNDAQRNGVFRIAQLYAGTMREEIAERGNAAFAAKREHERHTFCLGRQPGARATALFPYSLTRCAD